MADKDKKGKDKAVAADAGAIDDIFAAPKPKKDKGKKRDDKKAKVEEAARRSEVKEKKKKKEREKGKEKHQEEEPESGAVEEVVDPSVAVVAALGRAKEARASGKRDRKEVEEDRMWRDSRGDADRKRTEEGYFVFKEAELGIDPEAGGTPLCPFDCDCCF
ncbi:DUF1764-domain-containing protein [Cutaneotrichosporon oleaginosum]|uniref:DUF1764-domain-containing protein n=1 Tax=Cutaneotrichosporon oleaginosum TaxID=879819 RepID=A0A0J0XC09_9TREE|nr:DUF1764-domain-containing protein [Cutaneotrichosporon oleaginosum]KLT38606.1 DUF1764-domain-containing protein [Cutaneotrichosporon oleaginosum]